MRAARQAKGLTLNALAQTLNADAGHLSRVERAEAAASPELAEKIVTAIGGDFIHEMQILYPARFTGKKLPVKLKAPPLRLKVGGFIYVLIGAA
jgi:transcriptional regulator with XRE-family HTH domain